MALYDRLVGYADDGTLAEFRIPIHAFSSLLAEFARGSLTGAEAQAGITLVSGAPLDAGEIAEVNALLATVAGSVTAKIARANLINDVLMLSEFRIVQYNTPTKVKAKLGV